MRVHSTIASLRDTRAKAGRVALVPTMGNLHDGHLSLMQQARERADTVIATLFVNRLQFRPNEDFDAYPRTFEADCDLMQSIGVDHVFAPAESEMYPAPQTFHVEPRPALADILEGEFRPGFFRGVATVVMKLFQIARPEVAVFGKKDYQQLMVIRAMVEELNLPIEIVAGETARAGDGLALSSRNGYLSPAERLEAPRLHRVLSGVANAVRGGNRDYALLEQSAIGELRAAGWAPDYVALRKKLDLQWPSAESTGLVVLAAARLGSTRLIDNLEV